MQVLYTSPLFSNDGVPRQFLIEEAGVKYHLRRDMAVLRLIELGGTSAPLTAEVQKLRRAVMSAKRKIEKEGWFATSVPKKAVVQGWFLG